MTCPYNIKLIPSPDSVEDYKIEEGKARAIKSIFTLRDIVSLTTDGVTYDTTVDCAIVDDETCSHAFFIAVTDDNELVNVHLIQKEDRSSSSRV